MTPAYSVSLDNLTFRPPDDSSKRLLENVSFDVETGEFVSIVGRNGQGKTTIIRAIAGELDQSHITGKVVVGTSEVKGPIYTVASGVGIVHQFVQDDLVEGLSIKKNIQ